MDQTRTPFWDETSPMAPRQIPQVPYRSRVREPSEERAAAYPCCEGNFNFSTAQNEDDDFYHKKKMSRDPMSHRIIEKRRRDRMNNCLADLSRLIPAEYLKKGRGRVEKTEIIEMAIKHLQHLQQLQQNACNGHNPSTFPISQPQETSNTLDACPMTGSTNNTTCPQSCTSNGGTTCVPNGVTNTSPNVANGSPNGVANGSASSNMWEGENSEVSATSAGSGCGSGSGSGSGPGSGSGSGSGSTGNEVPPVSQQSTGVRPIVTEHYRLGYQECVSEAMHFLVEVEGVFACDALCVRLISHLQRHCDRIVKGDRLNFPRSRKPGETSSSSGSSTSGVCSSNTCASSAAPPPLEVGDRSVSPHPNTPAHSYKFKNTIKQRFSEQHREERRHKRRRAKSASPSPSGSRSPSPTTIKCSTSPRHEPHSGAAAEAAAVPIFVLHSKGSFYVPLTVAYDVLAPYLERLNSGNGTVIDSVPQSPRAGTPSRPPSVLHPVTISVNFPQCPVQHVQPPAAQLALPLQPESPEAFGLPPTCCPMPAWEGYGGNG